MHVSSYKRASLFALPHLVIDEARQFISEGSYRIVFMATFSFHACTCSFRSSCICIGLLSFAA